MSNLIFDYKFNKIISETFLKNHHSAEVYTIKIINIELNPYLSPNQIQIDSTTIFSNDSTERRKSKASVSFSFHRRTTVKLGYKSQEIGLILSSSRKQGKSTRNVVGRVFKCQVFERTALTRRPFHSQAFNCPSDILVVIAGSCL